MKEWFKIFGLSFFSDKIAGSAAKKGVSNFLVGFFLALVFLFCGMLGGDVCPFYTHYDDAPAFKQFIGNAFSGEEGSYIELECKDKLLTSQVGGDGRVIDTFTYEEDADAYKRGGYELVVDTREVDAIDAFILYALSSDGKTEIAYEDYLLLATSVQERYEVKIRYTNEEFIITNEKVAEFKSYLDSYTGNSSLVSDYKELILKKDDLTQKQYERSLYWIYLQAYCPGLFNSDKITGVPLLRNYYYAECLGSEVQNYLLVFKDMCSVSFVTDGGVREDFFGFYDKIGDGAVTDGGEAAAEDFIECVFSSFVTHEANLYLIYLVQYAILVFIAIILVGVITYAALNLLGCLERKGLGGVMKVVGSFNLFSGLIAAIFTLCMGFALSRDVVFMFGLVSFFVAINVRSVIYIILERRRIRKRDDEIEKNNSEQVDGEKESDEQEQEKVEPFKF